MVWSVWPRRVVRWAGADPGKGILIGKAIGIIGGRSAKLDSERGGELAGNLDRLYEYMIARLVEANTSNDTSLLDEVSALLLE